MKEFFLHFHLDSFQKLSKIRSQGLKCFDAAILNSFYQVVTKLSLVFSPQTPGRGILPRKFPLKGYF